MIEEAAVLVVEDDQKRLVPLRARRHRMVDSQNKVLAALDVRGRMVVVLLETEWVEVAPVRIDPGDRRQRAAGSVFQKASILAFDPDGQRGLPGQAGRGEVSELVVMAHAKERI